jgi:protein TonB
MKQEGTYLVAGAVALVLHGGLGASLAGVNPQDWNSRPHANVELEVIETPPPPPPPAPEPPPPPPEPKPRVVVHRVAPQVPPEAPRPPPVEAPPEPPKEPTPPVFGVTIDSTVTGEAAMAVPVGDTVATADRTPRKGPPAPVVSEGPPSFAPVPDSYISELPRVLQEIKEEGPPESRRLGLEGRVVMRVGIDRRGVVRSVKVIKKAGYGFDEVASHALWKFKFSPARTNDGHTVDFLITYTYRFTADK